MKDIKLYFKETREDGKNGHWEDYCDEDTGEIVTLWVDDKPEEIVQAVKEATPEEIQKLQELRKKYDEIDNKWYTISDEIKYLQDDLRSMKNEMRELQYGMEDEIGAAQTDAERDKLGNKYGAELDKLQNKIQRKIADIEKQTKKKQSLRTALDKASNDLYKYEEKVGYHITMSGRVISMHPHEVAKPKHKKYMYK